MAKFSVGYKPLDLPMTTTVCTNCGQFLDHEEAIKGAEPIDVSPKDIGDWHRWLFGETPEYEGEWFFSCPRCNVNLSDKPFRHVIVIYADAYPEIKTLLDDKFHLEGLIRQHQKNLYMYQEQLAKLDLTVPQVALRNSIDFEQEQIQIRKQELHTVKKKIQNKLASLASGF